MRQVSRGYGGAALTVQMHVDAGTEVEQDQRHSVLGVTRDGRMHERAPWLTIGVSVMALHGACLIGDVVPSTSTPSTMHTGWMSLAGAFSPAHT